MLSPHTSHKLLVTIALVLGAVSDPERIAELYYRWRIAKQFELTPSLQQIGSSGGQSAAPDTRILSLRSQFTF